MDTRESDDETEKPIGERATLPAPFMPDPMSLLFPLVVISPSEPPSECEIRESAGDLDPRTVRRGTVMVPSADDDAMASTEPVTIPVFKRSEVKLQPRAAQAAPAQAAPAKVTSASEAVSERGKPTVRDRSHDVATERAPGLRADSLEAAMTRATELASTRGAPAATEATTTDEAKATDKARANAGAMATDKATGGATGVATAPTPSPKRAGTNVVPAPDRADADAKELAALHEPGTVEPYGDLPRVSPDAADFVPVVVKEAPAVTVSKPKRETLESMLAATDRGGRENAVHRAEAVGHRRALSADAHGQIVVPELGRIEVHARLDSARVEVLVRADDDHGRHVIAANASELRAHVQAEVPQAAVHVARPSADFMTGSSLRDGGRGDQQTSRNAEDRENSPRGEAANARGRAFAGRSAARVRIVL